METNRTLRELSCADDYDPNSLPVDRACVECAGEARDQVRGKERGIAGTGDDVGRRRGGESRVQSRERAGEAGDRVGDDRIAEARVTLGVLVRIDDDRGDLRRETLDDMGGQRASVELDEALVDAAHAPAEAAGKDDAGDVGARDLHRTALRATRRHAHSLARKRSAPVKSR